METVRIDKYLWSIRVFKTRTDAMEACRGGRVKVNEQDAKPSRDIKTGDMITVRKGAVLYTYRVIEPIDKRQGAKLVSRFTENLTPKSELEKLHAPVETFFLQRDKGTGRPTKKERRDMERLWDELDY